jgi:hypothetical protein
MRQEWEKRRLPSRKVASARMREHKPGGASYKAGAQDDRSNYSRDQRSGGGTPQLIATVHQIKCLPLGVRKMTSSSAMRNHLRGSRRELQGRSPPIESYEAPQERLLGEKEVFT